MTVKKVMAAFVIISFSIVSTACSTKLTLTSTATPQQPTVTPTPIPPTETFTPIPPTFTLTPIPPTETITPLPPTSAPTLIPGIGEPIIIEDHAVQIIDAHPEDSLVSQSGTTLPLSPDNVFLILEIKVVKFIDLDWIGRNTTLSCGGTEVNPVLATHEYGSGGILTAFKLIFEVLKSSEFGTCLVHLKDQNIELSPFFE